MFYLDIAYVQTYVASILFECCICFTHMLQVFHLDVVAYVLQWLHACFPWCFKRMLQVFQLFWMYVARFQLDVGKIDLVFNVLH
jgi:hypothetical protein